MTKQPGRALAVHLAAGLIAVTAMSPLAIAQGYPAKPVRIVTTVSAGTAGDQLSRVIAKQLTDKSGQQFVVDNRPGASGLIGTLAVVKSPPDGYMLMLGNDSTLINPILHQKPPYDPTADLAPITIAANIPYAMIVHPSLPATSIKALVALAKARPGEINYATGGIPQRLAMEMFAGAAGIKLTTVDYKGTGPAFSDVLGGQIPMMFAGVTNALPYVASGRLRVLAVSSSRRSAALPDVPTMAEAGIAGYHYAVWMGYLAPAGTPVEIIDKLNTEIVRVIEAPDTRQLFDRLGFQPVGNTSADFVKQLRTDTVRLGELIRRAGIQIQ